MCGGPPRAHPGRGGPARALTSAAHDGDLDFGPDNPAQGFDFRNDGSGSVPRRAW